MMVIYGKQQQHLTLSRKAKLSFRWSSSTHTIKLMIHDFSPQRVCEYVCFHENPGVHTKERGIPRNKVSATQN